MAQLMIDVKDYKRNNNILQDLLISKATCASDDKKQLTLSMADPIDVNNNNNDCGVYSMPQEFSPHPIDCMVVVLDPDAEYILQNLSDEIFFHCFNFDRFMVRCLLMELHQRTFYHPSNDLYRDIGFDMSLLVTLSYLVNGNFEFIVHLGYFNHYSAESLKFCIQRTCQTIVHFLSPVYVSFPSSPEEQENVKSEFLRQFGVPGVVGVLECYYLRLQDVPPHEHHMYVSRRCVEPSITVQVICDQNHRFLDVNPRFSGNACNTHVWKRSHIKQIIQHSQERDPNTWLIADRGYPLSSSVINPYRNALNIQQESVNTALIEVRHVVDKSVALLKARFRCLNEPLQFSHNHAANVLSSCVVLHNYLLAKGQPVEANLYFQLPKHDILKNARYEDRFSPAGLLKREVITNFMFNNSLQILYKMRKNSNLSFINDSQHNHYNNSVNH